MKLSSKAALLSGLVFPGIGHITLKKYLRGSILILGTLAALSVIVSSAYQRALTIVDRINSGDVPVDAASIYAMVSDSASGAGDLTENVAVIVLAACWLFGIIDSYRVGVVQEKQNERAADSGAP
jgi:hypothetical protein